MYSSKILSISSHHNSTRMISGSPEKGQFLPLDFDVEVYVSADDVIQYPSSAHCEVPRVA